MIPKARKAPLPKITPKAEKKILRLFSAWNDMVEAVEAGQLLQTMQATNVALPAGVAVPLFNAMICAYARPFTDNHGLGPISSDYQTYPEFDPERHSRLLELRHNFGAHSSIASSGIKVFSKTPLNPGEAVAADQITFSFGKRRFLEPSYVTWLIQAPKTLQSFLHAEIAKLLVKTFTGKDLSKEVLIGRVLEEYKFTQFRKTF